MKKRYLLGMAAAFAITLFATNANAQEKKTEVGKALQKTGNAVEKGATAVGNKTAEVAVKGGAKVVDQTYKGKMAPDGSNVYIDGKNRTATPTPTCCSWRSVRRKKSNSSAAGKPR